MWNLIEFLVLEVATEVQAAGGTAMAAGLELYHPCLGNSDKFHCEILIWNFEIHTLDHCHHWFVKQFDGTGFLPCTNANGSGHQPTAGKTAMAAGLELYPPC